MGAAAALPPKHARWCRIPTDILRLFFGDDHKGCHPTWCQEPQRAVAAGPGYFLLTGGWEPAQHVGSDWTRRLTDRVRCQIRSRGLG